MKTISLSAPFRDYLRSILNTKSTYKTTIAHPRSIIILRSCLNAIAFGVVPASVATMINESILQKEENKFSAKEMVEHCLVKEIPWNKCGMLEIVTTVNSEMHRLEHPNGCADRVTCLRDRDKREKKALAMACDAFRSDVQKWQETLFAELEMYDSDVIAKEIS
jgi:hypothetical protein